MMKLNFIDYDQLRVKYTAIHCMPGECECECECKREFKSIHIYAFKFIRLMLNKLVQIL